MVANATPAVKPSPVRHFGRFELRRLLGKANGTMAWLAFDPRLGQEVMLTMPRVQPIGTAALEHWQRDVRLAARLNHPNLAHVIEVGTQDHWPFVAVDRALGVTLGEWVAAHPATPPVDVVPGCASCSKAWPSRTKPVSPTSTCNSTACSSANRARCG